MKLAEALILRADAQKRIEQLKQRMILNAKVQEGDTPAEDPQALLAQFEQTVSEQTRLIQQINRTNVVVRLANGQTIADALAVRDSLKVRQAALRDLAHAATISGARYTKSEVRFYSTIPVADLQAQADRLAREYRELDAQIQAQNWQADLIEG
jgi:hypothetical protein